MITIESIIAKRKARWEERHDIEYDKLLVRAAVREILKTPKLYEKILEKPYLLIEVAFSIVDKDRNTVPFFLNEVQKDFIEKLETLGTNKPFYVLKGRQQGFTTLITAIQLSFSIVRKNFSGMTLADTNSNAQAIFNDKARVVYDRLPEQLKPSEKYNSRNEMFFDKLNSSWRVATATDKVGRSRTLNFVHYSEIAFYDCDLSALQSGIGEAITAGAIQVYESTANGFNQAKDLWDSGSCHNLFYGWWRTAEYRSTEYEYLETTDGWLLERIKVLEEMGLDKEQITWYCKKYAGYIVKALIKQEYPITPEEAFISSGGSVFNKELLNTQLIKVAHLQPVAVGYFEYNKTCLPIFNSDNVQVDVEWKISNIKFKEDCDGYITLHELPLTQKDKDGNELKRAPYVIGGDTAGSGEDYFTAKVICNLDGRTVATLRKQRIDEDLYAEQLYCLGKYYNDALIGVELNYSRHPTRVLSQKYSYPNLYVRQSVNGAADVPEEDYGFLTTPKTKPIIISELVEIMRDAPSLEVDKQTLKEMLTFVKKDNGAQEAIDGAHDDLVMALAIAHFISKQQTHQWMDVVPEESDFIKQHFSVRQTGGNEDYINWEDM